MYCCYGIRSKVKVRYKTKIKLTSIQTWCNFGDIIRNQLTKFSNHEKTVCFLLVTSFGIAVIFPVTKRQ